MSNSRYVLITLAFKKYLDPILFAELAMFFLGILFITEKLPLWFRLTYACVFLALGVLLHYAGKALEEIRNWENAKIDQIREIRRLEGEITELEHVQAMSNDWLIEKTVVAGDIKIAGQLFSLPLQFQVTDLRAAMLQLTSNLKQQADELRAKEVPPQPSVYETVRRILKLEAPDYREIALTDTNGG